jgi:hypothetical protein
MCARFGGVVISPAINGLFLLERLLHRIARTQEATPMTGPRQNQRPI